jgi:hypothetical protein
VSPSRFVPTPGLDRSLERSPGIVAAVAKATVAVSEEAKRAAAPVSHRFQEGLSMDVGTDAAGRLVGRVIANWEFSLFVEYGNAHQTPRPVLRQALDASRGKALR